MPSKSRLLTILSSVSVMNNQVIYIIWYNYLLVILTVDTVEFNNLSKGYISKNKWAILLRHGTGG